MHRQLKLVCEPHADGHSLTSAPDPWSTATTRTVNHLWLNDLWEQYPLTHSHKPHIIIYNYSLPDSSVQSPVPNFSLYLNKRIIPRFLPLNPHTITEFHFYTQHVPLELSLSFKPDNLPQAPLLSPHTPAELPHRCSCPLSNRNTQIFIHDPLDSCSHHCDANLFPVRRVAFISLTARSGFLVLISGLLSKVSEKQHFISWRTSPKIGAIYLSEHHRESWKLLQPAGKNVWLSALSICSIFDFDFHHYDCD